MRIDAMLKRASEPLFSFEFFPPRDDAGAVQLFDTIAALSPLRPAFVSVTHGAGGSDRDDRTVRVVERIRRETGLEPMAHLTCREASVEDLVGAVRRYADAGIENVLALRGDPPAGDGAFVPHPQGLRFGSELVRLVRDTVDVCVGGACYPEKHIESESLDDDVDAARLKVEAGAAFLITQLFFDNRSYYDYLSRVRAAGVTVPIIPAIMPVTNVAQVYRFTAKIGATIPERLREALESRADDPAAALQLGVAWATLQCADLLARGAPGIHFITLNRSPAARAILSALRAGRVWEEEIRSEGSATAG